MQASMDEENLVMSCTHRDSSSPHGTTFFRPARDQNVQHPRLHFRFPFRLSFHLRTRSQYIAEIYRCLHGLDSSVNGCICDVCAATLTMEFSVVCGFFKL